MTWSNYVYDLSAFSDGFVKGEGALDYEQLRNLIISDQVKRRVPIEVREELLEAFSKTHVPREVVQNVEDCNALREET